MQRFEQYEVWVMSESSSSRWEMIASFADFDVASAVAYRRGRRVRLVHAIYQDGRLAEQRVLAELGTTREHP